MVITSTPPPQYVKSVLKKEHLSGKRKISRPSLIYRGGLGNKSVNFDQQVLVKSRTPTPNKAWYEKASSTMPMRKHPRNDHDDDDYDEPEEERTSPEQNSEGLFPQSQVNGQWYQNAPALSPTNRIKVRRRLSTDVLPQVLHIQRGNPPEKETNTC